MLQAQCPTRGPCSRLGPGERSLVNAGARPRRRLAGLIERVLEIGELDHVLLGELAGLQNPPERAR